MTLVWQVYFINHTTNLQDHNNKFWFCVKIDVERYLF